MDLEGINRATNPNQMRGQNAVVLARFMSKATKKNINRSDSAGSSKRDLENQAELMRHASELRRGEEANKAWVKTQAEERAAKFSVESMKERVQAVREASVITDADNNVIGEVSVNDRMHGLSTSGYRLSKKASAPEEASGTLTDNKAAEQAVSDTVAPQASSQQGANIPGWGAPAPSKEPEVSRNELRSAMARGPKPRVTKKAQKQRAITFSDADKTE